MSTSRYRLRPGVGANSTSAENLRPSRLDEYALTTAIPVAEKVSVLLRLCSVRLHGGATRLYKSPHLVFTPERVCSSVIDQGLCPGSIQLGSPCAPQVLDLTAWGTRIRIAKVRWRINAPPRWAMPRSQPRRHSIGPLLEDTGAGALVSMLPPSQDLDCKQQLSPGIAEISWPPKRRLETLAFPPASG